MYSLKYMLGSQVLKIQISKEGFLDNQRAHINSVFTKVPFQKNHDITNAHAVWRWKLSSLILLRTLNVGPDAVRYSGSLL